MKLKLSETSKFSTIPVSPIMSLFNQFSTRSLIALLDLLVHRVHLILPEIGQVCILKTLNNPVVDGWGRIGMRT